MVILIFSNASFVSVCGIYSVSVSSAVKGIPVLFLHIHSPLHPVEAKVFLHVSDPQVQELERPPAFSLGTKTVPRFFQELSSSAAYGTDVIEVHYGSVVSPSKLESMLHDGPDWFCNGFRHRDVEARPAKGQNTKSLPLPYRALRYAPSLPTQPPNLVVGRDIAPPPMVPDSTVI